MAKRPVPLYDFKAFGAAIKAARNEYGESRKKVSDELYISPRYLANIENKGQQPSLQVLPLSFQPVRSTLCVLYLPLGKRIRSPFSSRSYSFWDFAAHAPRSSRGRMVSMM